MDLSTAVLRKLKVLDALESPSTEDHALVYNRYLELHEGLQHEELAYWPSDFIPLIVMPALVDLVAIHVSNEFGITINLAEIEDLEVPIKRRIKRYNVKRDSEADVYQVDY